MNFLVPIKRWSWCHYEYTTTMAFSKRRDQLRKTKVNKMMKMFETWCKQTVKDNGSNKCKSSSNTTECGAMAMSSNEMSASCVVCFTDRPCIWRKKKKKRKKTTIMMSMTRMITTNDKEQNTMNGHTIGWTYLKQRCNCRHHIGTDGRAASPYARCAVAICCSGRVVITRLLHTHTNTGSVVGMSRRRDQRTCWATIESTTMSGDTALRRDNYTHTHTHSHTHNLRWVTSLRLTTPPYCWFKRAASKRGRLSTNRQRYTSSRVR